MPAGTDDDPFDWLDAPALAGPLAANGSDLESTYQAALDDALNALPDVRVWRQNAGRVRTDKGHWYVGAPAGAADLSGIVTPEGWRLEVECKARTGKARASQDRWARFITRSGGIYVRAQDSGRGVAEAVGLVRAAIDARRRARPP